MSKHQAFNPYLPSWEYVPDGEPYVFGDRLYVFGSHDRFNGEGFCLNNYVGWSAPVDDLSDWRYEGVIYDRLQDPLNKKGNMYMNAPDVCQGPDGRYYLYYQLHLDTGCSIAVADAPAGPYSYYGSVVWPDGTRYGEKKGDAYPFDPGVLADDDGRIFLYTGFGLGPGGFRTLMKMRGGSVDGGSVVELESDMKTIRGQQYATVPGPIASKGTLYEGHAFFEASSIRHIGERYYLVYSSELSHELCYATSDTPTGPWTYGGILVSIGDIGLPGVSADNARNFTGNTHGGMVCIRGQWYIFYHRQTNRQKCARQGCAEKITIREDGRIAQAEITSCGLNDGPLEGSGTYEARIACNLRGAQGTYAYVDVHHKEKEYPYFTQSGEDYEPAGAGTAEAARDPRATQSGGSRVGAEAAHNPHATQSGGEREGIEGGQYIANMRQGAVAGFKYFAFDGENRIEAVLRGSGEGKLLVSTEEGGAPAFTIEVTPSETWQRFEASGGPLSGVLPLYFRYEGSGAVDFQAFTIGRIHW